MSEMGKMQDALCKISDAAFGGELAWDRMGLEAFAKEVARRLRNEPVKAFVVDGIPYDEDALNRAVRIAAAELRGPSHD